MRAILTYHSIDGSGSPVSVTPEVFHAHCAFLSSGRVQVLPLETLVRAPAGTDAVALTFDDGFANFATQAAPLLRDHDLPATLFVVTDHVGGRNNWGGRTVRGIPDLPLLTWTDVAHLAGQGVEIGAHTRRHPDLTTLSDPALVDEVEGSVAVIEERLGQRPAAFAYPYGAVNTAAAGAARRACALACTTELRALGTHDDPALLPRLDMFYFRDPGQLEAWGTRTFRSRLWLRGQGRRLRGVMQGTGRRRGEAA